MFSNRFLSAEMGLIAFSGCAGASVANHVVNELARIHSPIVEMPPLCPEGTRPLAIRWDPLCIKVVVAQTGERPAGVFQLDLVELEQLDFVELRRRFQKVPAPAAWAARSAQLAEATRGGIPYMEVTVRRGQLAL